MNLKRVAGAGIKSLSQTNWFLHLNISGNSCDSFKSVFFFFLQAETFCKGRGSAMLALTVNQKCWTNFFKYTYTHTNDTPRLCDKDAQVDEEMEKDEDEEALFALPMRFFVFVQRGMNVSLPRLR